MISEPAPPHAEHLSVVVGLQVRDAVLWCIGLHVRTRHKASCTVVRLEVVDHQNEPERPVGGAAPYVNVQSRPCALKTLGLG
jgi:hypothetical protein